MEIVAEVLPPDPRQTWGLPSKDVPILAAAVYARASHLITGDLKHFGSLLGTSEGGVSILRPADYLRLDANDGERS